MDAAPVMAEVARHLRALSFDAFLIGNAAAALRGAPVTTVDLDFLFRKTPRNIAKIKALATALGAVVLRPYYPASDLFRVVRDDDGLQLDFMATIHGVRSFDGVRDRGSDVLVDGVPIRVASLDDVIRSKRAAGRPRDLAVSTCRRRVVHKRPSRKARLDAVKAESERGLHEMIRRWQALPPGRRTNFLRKRVGICRTAL